MFDFDQWKRMYSDYSLELLIFHIDKWMTWHHMKRKHKDRLTLIESHDEKTW